MPHKRARWAAYMILRGIGRSLQDIARATNTKSHSTVMSALDRASDDPEILEAVEEIRREVGL